MHKYFVYMLSNYSNRVLYTGVTNELSRRLQEHRSGIIKGFSQRYRLYKLVYFEIYENVSEARAREHQIKGWSRARKDELVICANPEWRDLAGQLTV